MTFKFPTQIDAAKSINTKLLIDASSETNLATVALGKIADKAPFNYKERSPFLCLDSSKFGDCLLKEYPANDPEFAVKKVSVGDTQFKIYLYSDDSCLVSFKWKASTSRAYIMWPFKLTRSYETSDFKLYIENQFQKLDFNTFCVKKRNYRSCRIEKGIFESILTKDLINIRREFQNSINLAFGDVMNKIKNRTSYAYPVNHQIKITYKKPSAIQFAVDLICPYIATKYPDCTFEIPTIKGRVLRPDGSFTDPEPMVIINGGRKTKFEKQLVDILNSDHSPVPIENQFAQKNGTPNMIAAGYFPHSNYTAHERVAIVAKVEELISLTSKDPARADVA